MIHELRMYKCRPGGVAKAIEASGTVGRRIREGDKYGKLEGHWSSEFGLLNQYVHLWAYDDLGEMARLRGELAKKEAWRNEFVPMMHPHILTQTVRVMRPVIDMKLVEGEGNFYELRTYRLKTGSMAEFCERMAKHMPAREKYSKNVGLWAGVMPDPNEVTHLWVYASLEERAQARVGSQADPDWKEFLGYAGTGIEEMNSTMLMPSPYSPRK